MSLQIIKIVTLLFVIVSLAGCGQKGDLYQPGKKYVAIVHYAQLV